jgi:deoxyribonuclease-4
VRIGVHVSIAGKISDALERARSLNCRTMQIFSRNPRGWHVKEIRGEEGAAFAEKRKRYDIRPLVVHVPYLINLTSPDDALYRRSVRAFTQDVRTADLLRAEYFVTHLGSHKGKGKRFGLRRFCRGLGEVLKRASPRVTVLLETTAGSGFSVGERFEDLRYILDHVKSPHSLGICFDTAHVFAAGSDIATEAGLKETLAEFDDIIGLGRIKVIHLNDSKSFLGSRVDRHEHIGRGAIGTAGFRRIVNQPYLSKIPMILETPKKSEGDDVMNVRTVRKLSKRRQG